MGMCGVGFISVLVGLRALHPKEGTPLGFEGAAGGSRAPSPVTGLPDMTLY